MSGKRRIAIIIPGGIGTGRYNVGVPVLERLVRILSRDFDITVFSLFKVNADYVPQGHEIVSIYSSNRIFRFIKLLAEFRRHHKTKSFQAIHGFWAMPSGFMAVLLSKLYGTRSIVSILGGDAVAFPDIGYGQLRRWVPRKLIMWALGHADELLLTPYLHDKLTAAGLQRVDVKMIPWGVDAGQFVYDDKSFGDTVEFLHIGNLHPIKDQVTLIRTFKIICDSIKAHLTIIGEGKMEKELKSLATSLDLDPYISFVAPLPHDQIPAYYHKANILLHTSLSEGHAMVVVEAMASGVVVCGTAVGLIYDLPDCFVTAPVGNYKLLAEKTLGVIADKSQFLRLQKRAYAWSQQHSIFWTAEKMGACYGNE